MCTGGTGGGGGLGGAAADFADSMAGFPSRGGKSVSGGYTASPSDSWAMSGHPATSGLGNFSVSGTPGNPTFTDSWSLPGHPISTGHQGTGMGFGTSTGAINEPSFLDHAISYVKKNAIPTLIGLGTSMAFGPVVGTLASSATRGVQSYTQGATPQEAIGQALLGGLLDAPSTFGNPLAGNLMSGLGSYAINQSKGYTPGSPSTDFGFSDYGGSAPNFQTILAPYSIPKSIIPQQAQSAQNFNTPTAPSAAAPDVIRQTTQSLLLPQINPPYSSKNIPNVMASRGVKGAGTVAPRNEWYS